jgi:hypothetical protein
MSMTRRIIGLGVFAFSLFITSGCDNSGRAANAVCSNGLTNPCSCADGSSGTQTCTNGQFAACVCRGPARCGDGICDNGETCTSCADDCGLCRMCSAAPSCSNAGGVPTHPATRADLDIFDGVSAPAVPDGGMSPMPQPNSSDCKAAQLRLRIAKVSVQKNGGQYFCIVSASDGSHSEAVLTDQTKNLGDGESDYFDPSIGVFWGQQALVKSADNLTITYKCYKTNPQASDWSSVLAALGGAAMQAGGTAGMYGWAFGVGAAAADAAAAAAKAASADDERLEEQQTLDKQTLLDLTNGRSWEIHHAWGGGVFGIGAYELSITVESWGCADYQPPLGG